MTNATPMLQVAPERVPEHQLAHEAGSLAREMARAYSQMLDHYRRELSFDQADARARDTGGSDLEQLEATPPDQLSWWVLGRVAQQDPARAHQAWERAQDEARQELTTGHRAARAVEADGTPWERAQFVAILSGFMADWQPRGGIEGALVETLAQAYTQQLRWLARLTVLSQTEADRQDRDIKARGSWAPPTVEAALTIDQAAAMVDRFNRLFTRTLRALRDLRRYAPHVVVQHAEQVNLAQAQINVGPARQARASDQLSG